MMGGGAGGGCGGSKKLRRVARKLFHTCGSFSFRQSQVDAPSVLPSVVISDLIIDSATSNKVNPDDFIETTPNVDPMNSTYKTMCAICPEALNYSSCTAPGQAIFTTQCSHAFHFDCIASNVRHGGVTCPICRAQWTHLPRNLKLAPCSFLCRRKRLWVKGGGVKKKPTMGESDFVEKTEGIRNHGSSGFIYILVFSKLIFNLLILKGRICPSNFDRN